MSKPCRKTKATLPAEQGKKAIELDAAAKAKREQARNALESIELAAALPDSLFKDIQRVHGDVDVGFAGWISIIGLEPKNEIERMICTQMIAMHGLTLDATKRAHKAEMLGHYREYVSTANKASRTFAALTESLNKQRGKTSEQKVTVEHVHIHEGGQAIVGNVDAGGRGSAADEDSSP